MTRILDLPEEAARVAISDGEFPATITGPGLVAVVMTQSWCPDWMRMKAWLSRLERRGEPGSEEITVYVLVYNKVSWNQEFMHHKEEVFGNNLIPYVRFYRDGVFLSDGNRMGSRQFLERFQPST